MFLGHFSIEQNVVQGKGMSSISLYVVSVSSGHCFLFCKIIIMVSLLFVPLGFWGTSQQLLEAVNDGSVSSVGCIPRYFINDWNHIHPFIHLLIYLKSTPSFAFYAKQHSLGCVLQQEISKCVVTWVWVFFICLFIHLTGESHISFGYAILVWKPDH